jgi:hypothetical protein
VADLEPSLTHAAAIAALAVSRLAILGSALTVYVDEVPVDDEPNDASGVGPEWPYAVFWSTPGSPVPAAERLAGWGGDITTTTQVTVAGLTRADVIGGVDRLILALHRRKPVLPGRIPGDIEHSGGSGPVQDPDPVPSNGGRPAWTAAVLFDLQSSPINPL